MLSLLPSFWAKLLWSFSQLQVGVADNNALVTCILTALQTQRRGAESLEWQIVEMAVEQMTPFRATPHRLRLGLLFALTFSQRDGRMRRRRGIAVKEKLRQRNTRIVMGDEKRKGAYYGRPESFLWLRRLKAVYQTMCAPRHIFLDWNVVVSTVLQLPTH